MSFSHAEIKCDKKNIYVNFGEKKGEDYQRVIMIKQEERRKPKAIIIINGEVIPTESIQEIGIKETQ
ncbi:MAG: hypothetical protein DIU66_001765 [Bacillota bacterium]|nr:MAG: hypothetical protein DIU66_04215 [Bacillota bacterium]